MPSILGSVDVVINKEIIGTGKAIRAYTRVVTNRRGAIWGGI